MCRKMLLFYLVSLVVSVLAKECDKHGILLYEDLGCSAEYGKNKCPVKYTCKGLEAVGKKCYFRGRSYENQEQVDDSLSRPSCDVGCFCRADAKSSGFTCAILDCPEWLGAYMKPGCYRKYSLDACCSVGQKCPPFDDGAKCIVGGKEYKEGESFYPVNSCLKCVCQKGFQGKLEEPFCRRSICGAQLKFSSQRKIQQSCAPFYIKQSSNEVLCCPDSWICPDGTETTQGNIKSEETCKFGGKVFKVGQEFTRANFTDSYQRSFPKIKCQCEIPPLMKCINV